MNPQLKQQLLTLYNKLKAYDQQQADRLQRWRNL